MKPLTIRIPSETLGFLIFVTSVYTQMYTRSNQHLHFRFLYVVGCILSKGLTRSGGNQTLSLIISSVGQAEKLESKPIAFRGLRTSSTRPDCLQAATWRADFAGRAVHLTLRHGMFNA